MATRGCTRIEEEDLSASICVHPWLILLFYAVARDSGEPALECVFSIFAEKDWPFVRILLGQRGMLQVEARRVLVGFGQR